jgi:glycosyltransferase involved in cell wall biosynthesis
MTLEQWHYLKSKNGLIELAISDSKLTIIPTYYQASSFPKKFKKNMKILHEGVIDSLLTKNRLGELSLNSQVTLREDIPVVTFISRNLEPMRGFPSFMRAIPALQHHHKTAHVIIVGGEGVSYSSASEDGRSWKTILLEELKGKLDLERIHFIPRLEYEELIKIYLRSNLHVYLSNAFVLSWSLTEIMACGTPILGLNNPMMKEFIIPGKTGALYQGSEKGLGKAISDLLKDRDQLDLWGTQARQLINRDYRFSKTIDQLEKLLEKLSCAF